MEHNHTTDLSAVTLHILLFNRPLSAFHNPLKSAFFTQTTSESGIVLKIKWKLSFIMR